MFGTYENENALIMMINLVGCVLAYGLLGMSLYLSTDVPLATKGYWAMAVLLLTTCLINLVKYRFDARASEDRIAKIEAARNEKLLQEMLEERGEK